MEGADGLISLDELLSDEVQEVKVKGRLMRLRVPIDLGVIVPLRRLQREEIQAWRKAFPSKDKEEEQKSLAQAGIKEELIRYEYKICSAALVACLDPEHGVDNEVKALRLIQFLGGTNHELVSTALEMAGLGGREADENPTVSQSSQDKP